jgi:hypothetical protein
MDVDMDGDEWHKSVRQKLAEKAKKVVEEQAARDAIGGRVTLRPPIDVELSDDGWDEVDESFGESPPGLGRKYPHISKEEVNTAAPHQVDQKSPHYPSIQPSERYIGHAIIEDSASETFVATATQPLFSQNERTSENNNSSMSPILPSLRGISNRVSANHSIPFPFPRGNGHSHANRSSVASNLCFYHQFFALFCS